jgi:LuxR family transcriptional regulator, maltose regulon positive regulatory protein
MESITNPGCDILQTRLYRPQSPGSLLARARLAEMLDFAPPKVLTLVTAPAGFGKTTLVSAQLDEMQCTGGHQNPGCLPSAWLAIDENDHNFFFFLRYFVVALRKIFPEALSETYKLIYSASEIDPEPISLILTNEITAISQRFVMVLDDFHRSSCPKLFNLLAGWTKHWPLPMHLVIISRTQPPLPLAGLKSQGRINDIRSRDLRFSPQEAEKYISLTTTRDPCNKTITNLLNHIEGWAAGLVLVSIALKKTSLDQDVESVLELGKQDMISYLADEVFSQMTTAMQDLLMKISILDTFSVSLCLALVNKNELDDEVTSFIENITHTELFISALHDKEGWYKMHHLMRGMLQTRLKNKFNPEEIKELHLNASNWYREQNLLTEALEHALKTDNYMILETILEQSLVIALNMEDHLMMIHLWQFISEEMIINNPQLLFYKAWLNLYAWNVDGIKDIIGRVEKVVMNEISDSKNNQSSFFGQLAFFKGYLAYRSNSYREAVKFNKKALSAFPDEWKYARGITVFYLGLSIRLSEGTQKATTFLHQSYQGFGNKDDVFALNHLFALGFIYLQDGDLKTSEQYSRLLLEKSRKNKSLRKEGYALLQLGIINYLWNRLDLAEQWFQEAYKLCSLITLIQAKIGCFGLALALQAQGNFEEALAVNQGLSEIELEQTGQISDLTQVNRLQILISQNQWKEAKHWADSYTKPFVDKLLMPNFEDPLIFKAKVLIVQNDRKDLPVIMEILKQYKEIATNTNNIRCKAEALALLALAESSAGNKTTARDLLIESLEIAARGKMIRLYLDLGSQMHKLLKQVTPGAEIAEFVQDLLAAFADSNAGQPLTNQITNSLPVHFTDGMERPLYENLSIREREVLLLMAETISMQEIADRLFITYATAKRHTINIYSKLGVHNRWEAVAFARENRII